MLQISIKNRFIFWFENKFAKNRLHKKIVFIFFLLLIIFLGFWGRAFIGSMQNFHQGEAYFFKQQYIKAITYFDRSIHWYTPFNPLIERSAEYLWEISKLAEQNNDEKLSLIALESIRNSFYSARSFYSPGLEWIDRSTSRINAINTKNEQMLPFKDNKGEQTEYLTNTEYNDPDILWTVIMEIGLFGWIGSAICFILYGSGNVKNSYAFLRDNWFWLLIIVISYALWVFGIIHA